LNSGQRLSESWRRGRTEGPWGFWGVAGALGCSLALFFWMNQPGFLRRFHELNSTTGKGILLLTFLLAWGALAACAIARRVWAGLFLAFFAASLLVSTSYMRIMAQAMSIVDAKNMREAAGSVGDALGQFHRAILLVALLVAAQVALVVWVRRRIRFRSTLPVVLCSLMVTVAYCSFILRGGVLAMLYFPANFEAGLHTVSLSLEPFIRGRFQKPHPPILIQEQPLDPAVRHVVMIIDESIEAGVFRSLMAGVVIPNATDFGTAYSFDNQSPGSNLLLRRAADPEAADQSVRQLQCLFEVAKRHGFATSYVDAQGVLEDKVVQDFFTPREVAFIDSVPAFRLYGPRYQRDLNAIPILLDQLGKGERTYTLMNKQGTHFPYASNLPPELAGVKEPYPVSVRRTSVDFLVGLAPKLPPATVVFYTSDHGQNFRAASPHNNQPGVCSVSEWQVPLLVLCSPDLGGWAQGLRMEWRNCASHAVMAETVRNLLGQRNPTVRSLRAAPAPGEVALHHAYCGSPMGLFGEPVQSLWIDKGKQIFVGAPGK